MNIALDNRIELVLSFQFPDPCPFHYLFLFIKIILLYLDDNAFGCQKED